MKKNNWFVYLLVAGLAFASISCNKDDKVDCDAIESQLENLGEDLDAALSAGDCEEIEKLFAKGVSLLRKGKNCDYVKDEVASAGADSVEEYIDFLEELRDEILTDLGC